MRQVPVGGHLLLPLLGTIGEPHGFQASLIARGEHHISHHERRAVDIHDAFELGAPLREHDARFPAQLALLRTERSNLARRETRQHEVTDDHRRGRATQCQNRNLVVVTPAHLARFGVESRELPVHRLHRNDIAVGDRRADHLARDGGAPDLSTVDLVQCHHLALTRTQQDESLADPDAPGDESGIRTGKEIEVEQAPARSSTNTRFPQPPSGVQISRFHDAEGISGIHV